MRKSNDDQSYNRNSWDGGAAYDDAYDRCV